MTVPTLGEKPWTAAELAAAEAFVTAMGEAGYEQFAKGAGCGRLLHCIRAALMAVETLPKRPTPIEAWGAVIEGTLFVDLISVEDDVVEAWRNRGADVRRVRIEVITDG
jgi:hypothetical protein